MKTSLEIINKLSEKEAVKLESQLVELGSAQEVEAESKRMTEKYAQLAKAIGDYNAKAKIVQDLSRGIRASVKSSFGIFDNFEKKVKELGLELPNDFKTKRKTIENLSKMAEKLSLKPFEVSANPGSY
jgi:hypothetical protein